MAERGRPSSYTPEIALTICERIRNGESVLKICEDAGMPSQSMVYRWLEENLEFREKYTKAKEGQADRWAEEIVQISDKSDSDEEGVQRSRLRVDTRKWLMARMAPKKYGEHVVNEMVGPNGGPVQHHIVTDADRVKALEVLIAKSKLKTA